MEDVEALARVTRAIGIPVATGERLCTKFAFQDCCAARRWTSSSPTSATPVG